MVDPPADTRRRFLKGVVGSGIAGAVGVGAATALQTTTRTSQGGGITPYRGVRSVDGPADRPLPQVPVAVDEDGYLHGRWPRSTRDSIAPQTDIGGMRYSADWFRYCDFSDYAGFQPDAGADTYLRAAPDSPYAWQDRTYDPGERLHAEDFTDYETWGNGIGEPGLGKPALAIWRWMGSFPPEGTLEGGEWQSQGSSTPFFVQVVRSPQVDRLRKTEDGWIQASTSPDGFVAWSATCPLACAVTGFKAYGFTEKFYDGDEVYCPLCLSVYAPFDIVQAQFAAPGWDVERRITDLSVFP